MSQWRDLFKMPSGIMVSGVSAMARAAEGMQDALNATVDTFADATVGSGRGSQWDRGGNGSSNVGYNRAVPPVQRLTPVSPQAWPGAGSPQAALSGGGGWPPWGGIATDPRVSRVPGDDLSDDMLKVVQYDIVYTKPDEERCIACGETTLVNYNTRVDQLSAVLVAQYVRNQLARPNHHGEDDIYSAENLRYWRVSLRVTDRFAKEESFYDRRQTHALERIARVLGG